MPWWCHQVLITEILKQPQSGSRSTKNTIRYPVSCKLRGRYSADDQMFAESVEQFGKGKERERTKRREQRFVFVRLSFLSPQHTLTPTTTCSWGVFSLFFFIYLSNLPFDYILLFFIYYKNAEDRVHFFPSYCQTDSHPRCCQVGSRFWYGLLQTTPTRWNRYVLSLFFTLSFFLYSVNIINVSFY